MKNLFLILILAFAFGCEDDDGEIVRRGNDASLADVEMPAEDSRLIDASDLDGELPVADGILPDLDMELPVQDAEAVATDLEVVQGDATPEVLDAGELASDAALSDM